MISDRLFELAFQFRKIKLWDRLYDSQLFAVRHSDGSLGYCCVMGALGEHLALAVYPDGAGLESYRRMYTDREGLRPWETREFVFSQDCVMCSYTSKGKLKPRELEEVDQYCGKRGVKPAGKHAYPQFERFLPQRHPWFLEDEADQTHLAEALESCLEINDRLILTPPEAVGFTEGAPVGRSIPLLEKREGGFAWSSHPLPEPLPERYPSFSADDDITQRTLAKARRSDAVWACEVTLSPEPVVEGWNEEEKEPIGAPYYPYMMFVMDVERDFVLHAGISHSLEECAEVLGQKLVELARENGIPQSVYVLSKRTRAMLAPLLKRMGAKLSVRKSIPVLEDAIMSFVRRMTGEEEEEEEEGISAEEREIIMHAFFMNNRAWDDGEAYYSTNPDTHGAAVTSKARLADLNLYEGRPFKYVFDFGDDWRFQCKVLKWTDEAVDKARVIRSVGDAPPQYPEWDDE